MSSGLLMARQPILDRQGRVHAYELLYRKGEIGNADETRSTLNAMAEVGLGRLVGEKAAFLNLSREVLASVCPSLLPSGRVVLELSEDTALDEATEKRITELKREGYRLAYDGFTFQPHQLAFVGRVDLIKVDIVDTPWPLIERALPLLKAGGTRLLADKVEDRETHDRCLGAGFDLFQGYYFAHPETLAVKDMDARKRAVLTLLNALNRPDATAVQLESAIAGDAALSARLLKLVNSVGFGASRGIDSIRLAIQMLGIQRLQAFATVLAASGATGKDNRALGDLGLIRARMCERTACQLGHGDPQKHFTIGLLSVLDALINLPMSVIVAELALSAEVSAALLDPDQSETLRIVTAQERGDWSALNGYALDVDDLNLAYAAAVADTETLN